MTKGENDTVIQVKNLVKKYGETKAIDGVSFSVRKGEIFGFLGPNGAGKTTTLEIIETLREPTSGEVIVGGYSIRDDARKIKTIIGVQLQSVGFYEGLNLRETLNLFAGLYNIEIDALEILRHVGLEEKHAAKVKQLSGGQKQRFSLATTLVNKPEIIFLDEPTTGLDPQSRRNLWDMILKLQKEGVTVVITTHYMDEAEYLCDRIALLDKGKLLKLDTPHNLIEELIATGFKKEIEVKQANLEDVFLAMTGRELRE